VAPPHLEPLPDQLFTIRTSVPEEDDLDERAAS
jgi:hypothetical protein